MSGERGIPQGASGDDAQWMARFTSLPDHDVDALLEGEVPVGLDDLAPVAEVAGALRRRAAQEVAPPMGEALRAQLAAGNVVPLDGARLVRRPLIGAAAAAAVVLLALVAGASQEVLPDGVQRVVASVAEQVGIDLPSPADDEVDGTPTGATSEAPPATTPGGATPADPGTPGDGEPATPATPPSDKGNGVDPSEVDNNGIGDGVGGGQGQGQGQAQEQGQGATPPSTTPTVPAPPSPDATTSEAPGGSARDAAKGPRG